MWICEIQRIWCSGFAARFSSVLHSAKKDRDNPNIILNAICIVSVRLADCVCV